MGYIKGISRKQQLMRSLEEMVGAQAIVRVIDRFIDAIDLSKLGFTKTTPAETGRPPYSPKIMCKLYVYGYVNGIRSSRKLERETLRNIEVMWLIESLKPGYKTISEFRRENIRPLQKLFMEFVKLCKSWELTDGEIIAVDGTKIKASNNKKNNYSEKKIDARLTRIGKQIETYLNEMECADDAENSEQPADDAKMQDLSERKECYERYKKQLAENDVNEISTVDPDARLMGNNRGGVDVAYNVQIAVEGKYDIVTDFNVSLNPSDHHQLADMAKKVMKTLNIKRFTVLADKGYYNGEDLLRLKKLKVIAIVAKQKPSDSKELPEDLRTDKFVYDEANDAYTCPMGQIMTGPRGKSAKRRNYTNKKACIDCPRKSECLTGKTEYRTITRSQYSKIYEETDKRYAKNKELYKRRQMMVEHPFGTVKHTMHGGYFLLRTRRKVRTEVALLFLGYNIKRAVNVLGFDDIMARLETVLRSFFSFYRYILVNNDRILKITMIFQGKYQLA